MMSDWPKVTVLIVTFDRPREIRLTIKSLVEKIRYPGPLTWHIADDGSPDDYIPNLRHDFLDLDMQASVTVRLGWGANVNKALNCIKTDYIYLNEDDYVALREVDLRRGVAMLEAMETVGLVRYDGLSGHALNMNLREAATERAGKFDFLLIGRNSPHLNIYSNRPHLRHRRFTNFYGLYDEGRTLGLTETAYAHTYRNKRGGPAIVALGNGIERAYDHIGRSRQLSEYDVGRKK